MSRLAAGFTVRGGDFRLESISLPIAEEGPAGNLLRVGLLENSDGMPGNVLEWLSVGQAWPPAVSPFKTLTTLPSTVHPTLHSNAQYWIVAEIAVMPPIYAVMTYSWYHTRNAVWTPVWHHFQSYDLPYSDWSWDSWEEYMTFPPLAFQVEGTQTVGVGTGPFATRVLAAVPSPFRGRTTVAYELAQPGSVEATVYSVTGSRIRKLMRGEQAAGPNRVTWDGHDEDGRVAPAGLYILRLEMAGTRLHQRLIKLD